MAVLQWQYGPAPKIVIPARVPPVLRANQGISCKITLVWPVEVTVLPVMLMPAVHPVSIITIYPMVSVPLVRWGAIPASLPHSALAASTSTT